jgi:hypothetical protein
MRCPGASDYDPANRLRRPVISTGSRPALRSVELPDIPLPPPPAAVETEELHRRIKAASERMAEAGLDALVVYGDREHFANLRYLSGFDPRFEEAALVIHADRAPALVVGNEGLVYADGLGLDVECVLAQTFSLPGQDRTKAPRLDHALLRAGIAKGSRIGLAGWKTLGLSEQPGGRTGLAAPHFLVEALIEAVGPGGVVRDATDLLIGPATGLRLQASAPEIAEFEYGAAFASAHVIAALTALKPDMSELELAAEMRLSGYPLSCHPMIISGRDELVPLRSPTGRRIQLGETLMVAVGLWGGLTARAGLVAACKSDLDASKRSYVETFASAYLTLTKRWYESVAVGVRASDVFAQIDELVEEMPFGLALNPGHHTHLDEWVESPFASDSDAILASGSMLQCDMIPAGMPGWAVCNVEDTVCLADRELRSELFARYPELDERVRMRRRFLEDIVGIHPSDDVVPLSNLPGWFAPYLLDRSTILCFND